MRLLCVCFEIMKAEVLVYAPGRGGQGHRCQCAEPVTQRLAKIAGVRKGRVLETLWGWPQEHLVVAFPIGVPLRRRVKQTPASGAAVTLQPEARGDTRVTEHVDFSRESSWPAVRVSREVGLNKGLWVQRCVGGAVLWGRAAVTKHHQQGGAGGAKTTRFLSHSSRGQISETMKTLRQRLFQAFKLLVQPGSSQLLSSWLHHSSLRPPLGMAFSPRVSESFLLRTPFRAHPIQLICIRGC